MKKHHKKLLAVGVLGSLALALAQGSTFITIGSGSTTGVYFPIATGLAKLANDANNGIRANARSTGGSVFNLNALASGELDMALAQNDITFYAYHGSSLPAFEGKANSKLRVLASLYPELVQLVARKEAKIGSIADLKGKRVVIGDIGSGTEQNVRQVLEMYGLKFEDLGQAIRVGSTQGVQLMQDGRADALFFTAGLGASAIAQIAQTVNVSVVPIGGNQASALIKKYPFYARVNIPANTYKGQGATVPTVAVQSILVTTTALSDDVVYRFMKDTFGNEKDLKALHPNLNTFYSAQKAVSALPAPLHPGAAKFFREAGVSVK